MDDDRIDGEEFRARLEARRAALGEAAAASEEAARPVALDQSRFGRVSRVDALQQQAMAREAQRRRQLELQRIDAALKRIDRGEFGRCLLCGERIETPRLVAEPTTPTCISCAKAKDDAR